MNEMKKPSPPSISICIPAHNESICISNILSRALSIENINVTEILVCANGCTDDTTEQVKKFSEQHPKIRLIEETKASKIIAWNRLIHEAANNFVVFFDADVDFKNNAILHLIHGLQDANAIIAAGMLLPQNKNMQLSRKLHGFIMLPLNRDYISGGLYAVKKDLLLQLLLASGFTEMPKAFSEDIFLTIFVPKNNIKVVPTAVAYFIPPSREELIRYFARGKAQLIDMESRFPAFYKRFKKERLWDKNPLVIYTEKIFSNNKSNNILKGTFSAIGKRIFHFVYKEEINQFVQALLSQSTDSDAVMAQLTRSDSSRELIKSKTSPK